MKQLTTAEAIAFHKKGEWRSWTAEQIFCFQIFQETLCVDFADLRKSASEVLRRPVKYTEFSSRGRAKLIKEYIRGQ